MKYLFFKLAKSEKSVLILYIIGQEKLLSNVVLKITENFNFSSLLNYLNYDNWIYLLFYQYLLIQFYLKVNDNN